MKEIQLGKIYKDLVTGFEGTATSITKYIMGCDRVSLTPQKDKDGKLPDTCTFDIGTLTQIGDGCYYTLKKDDEKESKKHESIGGPDKYQGERAY